MTLETGSLTTIEKLIATKNSIPLDKIDRMGVCTGDDGTEVIRCHLKLPLQYVDNSITLTDVKRKRRRIVTGLGIYGVRFEIAFWVTYFYDKKLAKNGKQESMRYRYPEKIFYKGLENSRYTNIVFEEVIRLHLSGLNNLETIEHLKDEHGVDISEKEIRLMLKYKANNIKIKPFTVKTLGIDEIHLKGLKKYYVVLQDLDKPCVLGIARGKKASSVQNVIDEAKKNQ